MPTMFVRMKNWISSEQTAAIMTIKHTINTLHCFFLQRYAGPPPFSVTRVSVSWKFSCVLKSCWSVQQPCMFLPLRSFRFYLLPRPCRASSSFPIKVFYFVILMSVTIIFLFFQIWLLLHPLLPEERWASPLISSLFGPNWATQVKYYIARNHNLTSQDLTICTKYDIHLSLDNITGKKQEERSLF